MSRLSTLADRLRVGPERASKRYLSRWWLQLYRRIESRVSLDTDSETRRIQKVMVVVAAVVGSLATLFNATALFQPDDCAHRSPCGGDVVACPGMETEGRRHRTGRHPPLALAAPPTPRAGFLVLGMAETSRPSRLIQWRGTGCAELDQTRRVLRSSTPMG